MGEAPFSRMVQFSCMILPKASTSLSNGTNKCVVQACGKIMQEYRTTLAKGASSRSHSATLEICALTFLGESMTLSCKSHVHEHRRNAMLR